MDVRERVTELLAEAEKHSRDEHIARFRRGYVWVYVVNKNVEKDAMAMSWSFGSRIEVRVARWPGENNPRLWNYDSYEAAYDDGWRIAEWDKE